MYFYLSLFSDFFILHLNPIPSLLRPILQEICSNFVPLFSDSIFEFSKANYISHFMLFLSIPQGLCQLQSDGRPREALEYCSLLK